MALTRRRFLAVTGGATAALALPGCGLGREQQTGEALRSAVRVPAPFTVPLPVPRVARPVRSTTDTDYYEITHRAAALEIIPGTRTPVLGYDGEFPGPTIVSTSGRRTVVRHTNELHIPTVVHLHGGHTPASSDGFPTDLILPAGTDPRSHRVHPTPSGSDSPAPVRGAEPVPPAGASVGSKDYTYPMQQRAATLWYHDHRMDFTGPAVYRGLAGFHLVHDEGELSLPLPTGDRDIPLMITDRAFEADGSFRYPAVDATMTGEPGVEHAYMEGVLGDVVLVNGAPWPELEVSGTTYRFRLLNASNARRYDLALDPAPPDGPAFVQVGSDGGLLAEPVEHRSIRMAPAERFDVVVDFGRYAVGTVVTLRNRLGSGPTAQAMRFRVVRRGARDSSVPARLGMVERLDAEPVAAVREFRFTRGGVHGRGGWTINGQPYDPARVDARPALGEVERWRFVTDVHHPVHVHLDAFQVASRGAHGPGPYDAGYKDTVDVRPAEVVDVLVRFRDYAGTYVMHCHNLEHEDMMMMANFATH